MVGRQDVAGRVKGEPFDTAAAVFRLPDAAEFVVDILQRAAAPVFAPDQVARSVVGVAAADRADLHVLFAALSEGMGLLPFQTAYRIVFVYAADMSLGAAGFPMQRVAFDVADGFAIAADAVQVAAAVVQVVDDGAVGQLGTDTVAVAVVTVADFDNESASVRSRSRPVCLCALWRGGVRTGRRRIPRFRYCPPLF